MGYIVGRNSSGTPTPEVAARPNPTTTIVVNREGKSPAKTDTAAPADQTPSNPPPEERPAEVKPAPMPRAEKPKPPEPKPPEAPVPTKPSIEGPQPGQTFLQVVATTRADAELIAETLAKKGFHTTVAPGPNAQLFRVLVGPLKNAADIAETRVRLESTGFKNPYVRKY